MSEGKIPEASWSKFTNKAGNRQIIYGCRLYNSKSRSTTINEYKCSIIRSIIRVLMPFFWPLQFFHLEQKSWSIP